MARGFESKDVEFQQAEAERRRARTPPSTDEERQTSAARRTLELALAKARADFHSATHPTHRDMLERAIAALEEQLRRA